MSRDAWEWADQFKPAQPGPEKSWGMYYTAGITATAIDAAIAFADRFKKPPPPLYVPEEDGPVYQFAADAIAALDLPVAEDFGAAFFSRCKDRLKFATYPDGIVALAEMSEDIYSQSIPRLPPMISPVLSKGIEGARWRDKVKQIGLFAQEFSIGQVLETCHEIACQYMAGLPNIARIDWAEFDNLVDNPPSPATLSIEVQLTGLPEVVEYMIYPLYKAEHMQSGLYSQLRDTLDRNVCAASGLAFTDQNRWGERLVLPTRYKGADVVTTYLRDTPLMKPFE